MNKKITCLSLFDGMSCGRIALDRAGIKVDKYYASEIDKYASKVSQANYPDIIRLGDVTRWKEWDLENIDMIIAGSPCQGFSFAGKQLNFDDPRSALFFTFIDILKHYKPKYFLLENVIMKAEYNDVISSMLGELYPACVNQLDMFRAGRLEPIEINSSLVSAQNRRRLYWTNIPNIKQPEDKGILLKDILEDGGIADKRMINKGKSHCLTARYAGAEYKNSIERRQRTMIGCIQVGEADLNGHDCIKRVYSPDGKAPTLTAICGGNQEPKVAIVDDIYNNRPPRIYEEKCPTLRSERSGLKVVNELTWRKLTPLECEHLQTVNTTYNMEIILCLDQVKNYVNAVNKNHRLQKLVLSAEKKQLKEFAKLVRNNIKQNNQPIKCIVQQPVVMQTQNQIKKCTKTNQEEKFSNVNTVIKHIMYNFQDIGVDSVTQIASINTILGKITNVGKEELRQNVNGLRNQKNGNRQLSLYGKEIMQLVENVGITTEKKETDKCTFTTLYHSNTESIEAMLIILYYFAEVVIDLHTQEKTEASNLSLNYIFENSYTAHVSNSQRYKMLGNGWTVDVIAHIFSKINQKPLAIV